MGLYTVTTINPPVFMRFAILSPLRLRANRPREQYNRRRSRLQIESGLRAALFVQRNVTLRFTGDFRGGRSSSLRVVWLPAVSRTQFSFNDQSMIVADNA